MGYAYSVGPDTPDFRKTLGKDANYVFGARAVVGLGEVQGRPRLLSAPPRNTPKPSQPSTATSPTTTTPSRPPPVSPSSTRSKTRARWIPKEVRDALAALDVVTFYGLLKFDSRGINVYKPMVVNQIQNGRT